MGGDQDGRVVTVREGQYTLVFPRFTRAVFHSPADRYYEDFQTDLYYEKKWMMGRGTLRRVFVHESLKDYEASTLMGMLLGTLYDSHLKAQQSVF